MAHIPVDGKEGPADVCVIELGGTIGTLATVFLTLAVGLLAICGLKQTD